jgi:hypothetical protein
VSPKDEPVVASGWPIWTTWPRAGLVELREYCLNVKQLMLEPLSVTGA